MNTKIFDCITFFRENFMANLRFEILADIVDFFVVCESCFDHRNKYKGFNFELKNEKFKKKIIYLKLNEPFQSSDNLWSNQAYQRDFLLEKLDINKNDYLMFSDPDEIPNPKQLYKFRLKKKYGIFMQKHFMYKFNIIADQYTPWEGTRISMRKNITSINFMREKILKKNIRKWWRIDKEKNIQLIENGGWHFNNFLSPEELSIKLKTFAHSEFADKEFSDPEIIRKKIKNNEDLFGRKHFFKKIENINYEILPEYILNNINNYKNYF
jgi:beta-1,4-mannosyl-glycoprotein beta-1,4-N-acetylglucosaminyltransferase